MKPNRTLICALALISICSLSSVAEAEAKPIFKKKAVALGDSQQERELRSALQQIARERKPISKLGVVLANIHDFDATLRKEAKARLDMTDRLQVISIEPGSIGEKLGLAFGDKLIQLNELYFPRGSKALSQISERDIARINWDEEIDMVIIRGGYGQSLSLSDRTASAAATPPSNQGSEG
ncbi:hypothetical protein [Pelagicoccus sp. SDUM812003]|uniref:hypothetical protein n=1 Tax=Pelagicoccus sp. SDUM812003 TaxID=3041267 RepID=UPI0028109635|nr:hypothetical protein [Pelagicoccus sp. SDUM812003]MDQ8203313.1 hypothetical protein [Pelagicoccus sp. SDUM812003]